MHIKKLTYITAFIGLISVSTAAAQGHMDIDQKWLCRSLFNPAATGNTNALELYGIAREQWMGVEGAPSTQLFYGHYLFPDAQSGVGLGITNESIGFYRVLDVKAAYAYHIPLSDELTLSLGLSGMVSRTFRDDAKINYDHPELAVTPPFDARTGLNFDAGVELRNRWLKFGISALRLIETDDNPVSYRSFMVYAASRFRLAGNVDFGPVVAGTLDHSAINGETGVTVYFKKQGRHSQLSRLNNAYETYDFLWMGAFVRSYGDLSLTAGIGINEQWRLGYAFHYSFQYRSEYSPSTHEILLSWRLLSGSGGARYYRCEDC